MPFAHSAKNKKIMSQMLQKGDSLESEILKAPLRLSSAPKQSALKTRTRVLNNFENLF